MSALPQLAALLAQPTWSDNNSFAPDLDHPYVLNNGTPFEPRCFRVPTTLGQILIDVDDDGIRPSGGEDETLWTAPVRAQFVAWLSHYDESNARLAAMREIGYEPIEDTLECSAACPAATYVGSW